MDFKVVMTKTLQQAIMSKLKTTKNFGQKIKRILEPRYIITEIKKTFSRRAQQENGWRVETVSGLEGDRVAEITQFES